ncbi:MAG: hypothetical protein ACLGH1_05880 [Gammaproteobacteria bacterium]
MSTKTQSALRATLKQEDAALKGRLPDAPQSETNTPTAAPVAPTAPVSSAAPETPAQPVTAPASAATAPASTATAPAQAAVTVKPEKRTPERFKLAPSDRRRLATLRDALKAAGRRPSKSELVRAGLAALAAQGAADVMALVAGLSPAARAKTGKARRTKGRKAGAKRKGKSASKKR